jgi:lactoylglutathione lyase
MRIMHTMHDTDGESRALNRVLHQVLGMRLLRRSDYPGGRFTNAFVGYDDEARSAVTELTHNWDTQSYEPRDGYGQVAIEVDNAAATCDAVREMGGKVIREAGPMKHGTTVIAFAEVPDGYKIEFIQRKSA